MPTNTPNLNLIKPLTTEHYDVVVANANNDILDTAVGDVYTKSEVDGLVADKQDALISGTNIKTVNGNDILGSGDLVIATSSDWNAIVATLTYASADSPTFVANTSIDLTSVISVGMKIKLTQTTVKYFIVTEITSTTITLYGGTDYALADAAITLPSYSSMKAPFGFPLDSTKWTVRFKEDTTEFNQSSPTQNTWYNMYALSIPIGMWEIEWSGMIAVISTASKTGVRVQATLSTTNNSQTDNDFTAYQGINGASGALVCIGSVSRRKVLSLASKTTYYLNIRTTSASADVANITNSVNNQPTIIKAVCAYL